MQKTITIVKKELPKLNIFQKLVAIMKSLGLYDDLIII